MGDGDRSRFTPLLGLASPVQGGVAKGDTGEVAGGDGSRVDVRSMSLKAEVKVLVLSRFGYVKPSSAGEGSWEDWKRNG